MTPPVLYLASQSPRRLALIRQLCIEPHLLLPDEHEDAEALELPLSREKPLHYVERVTLLKWQAARARLRQRAWPAAPILSSDTTVALDGDILGKPESRAEAVRMLKRLSGRRHEVLTSVVLGRAKPQQLTSRSQVTFRPLSAKEIKAYVDSGEPMGKAGAYAIQGAAQRWISELRGSYSGVMGLPLFETDQLLHQVRLRA